MANPFVTKTTDSEANNPRQVNNLLHTLRAEHYRHLRNIKKVPDSPQSLLCCNDRSSSTLPVSLIFPPSTPEVSNIETRTAGPTPPSWAARPRKDIVCETPSWRRQALLKIVVPSLSLCCLNLIRDACNDADFPKVVEFIPPHLRRALLRYSAVCCPLSQSELHALCNESGHVDGQLIVVGPNTLRKDHFRRILDDTMDDVEREEWSWDSPDLENDDPPLHALALLSTSLSHSAYLTLPPTLTRLALVNLTSALPLHRLHRLCPLLIVLDLSYNKWLNSPSRKAGISMLEDVEWCKFLDLRLLGLRECQVTPRALREVNNERWDDVVIIQ